MSSTLTPANLDAVVKAYDLRGTFPDQVDETLARRLGQAFADLAGPRLVVGCDMRPSSPGLVAAFAEGAISRGADVVDIGLCSTDELYFASGRLDRAGAMFTASHNPAQYNGVKLCRSGAVPVGRDSGLAELRTALARPEPEPAAVPGRFQREDLLEEYAAFLVGLAPVTGRRLRVVVDAGNGMAGLTAPAVLGRLDLDVEEMYFELDGTFPHHEANPIDPSTLVDLTARVRESGADLGLAFDGDADRCFLVDEEGTPVDPSALTALIAERELARHPGSTVIHNLITSRAVPELVAEHGGTAVRTRVGHSFIKQRMAETGAVFGGEHSGHFYFRDFWRADSGMLAALHALAALAGTDQTASALLGRYSPYCASGEVNSTVADQAGALGRVEALFASLASEEGGVVDDLDGLTLTTPQWWCNVRPSNTEPLLRLNVEGEDRATMERVRDRVLSEIRTDDRTSS